jgi:hypothetical protein
VARVVIPVVVDLSHTTLARRALLRRNQKSLPKAETEDREI